MPWVALRRADDGRILEALPGKTAGVKTKV